MCFPLGPIDEDDTCGDCEYFDGESDMCSSRGESVMDFDDICDDFDRLVY